MLPGTCKKLLICPLVLGEYIELSLEPLYSRDCWTSQFYQAQFDEVMNKFDASDFSNDKKLSGEFLLGYHCQRRELLNFIKNDKKVEDQEEMEG